MALFSICNPLTASVYLDLWEGCGEHDRAKRLPRRLQLEGELYTPQVTFSNKELQPITTMYFYIMNCEQDWEASGHILFHFCCLLRKLAKDWIMIVHHIVYILAIKTFQQPGNSQGVLSQEWTAIRTILMSKYSTSQWILKRGGSSVHVTDCLKHALWGVWHVGDISPQEIFWFQTFWDCFWCRFGVKQQELDNQLPNLVNVFEAFKCSHNLKAWLCFPLQRQQSSCEAQEIFF